MLINLEAFSNYADIIANGNIEAVGVDFETNGLTARLGHKSFIMGFAYGDVRYSVQTTDEAIIPLMQKFFSSKTTTYCAHNIFFELDFLKHQFKTDVMGELYDTQVFERIAHNGYTSYSLENCAIRHKQYKYVPMMKWLAETKKPHHEAPENLIVPYVEQDAWLSLYLYNEQRDTFKAFDSSPVPVAKLRKLESRTTRDLFRMRETGLLLDVSYCYLAQTHEQKREQKAREEFKALTGKDFVNSRQCLAPIFKQLKLPTLKTDLNNESFSDDTLELSKDQPVVKVIRTIRNAQKRRTTYWDNFLDLQIDGVIHPNIRQSGTVTGRFSCSNPNAQNWPDDSETGSEYPIRRAFIAPSGCKILSMDYKQMEYRFLMDTSRDMKGISDILNGADPHQRAADNAGVSRSAAKNAVFAKIYGAGIEKLSEMLGITHYQAMMLSASITQNAPAAADYCKSLIKQAQQCGYGWNLYGRRYDFTLSKPYCYPDYKIQGGCSEILRVAITKINDFLDMMKKGRTALIMVIHDELVLQIDECDMHLIAPMKQLMIEAYKPWQLPMDVSSAIGDNFHDLQEC